MRESAIKAVLCVSALVSVAVVIAIFAFFVYFSFPIIGDGMLSSIFSVRWHPFHGEYGIVTMIVGSLCLSLSSLVLAYPIGVGICCFAYSGAPTPIIKVVMAVVRFMTSIPTVVYGFVAVFVLVPFLRRCFDVGTGYSWFATSVMLSILIIPTIVLVIQSRLCNSDDQLCLMSSALGLTSIQKVLWVLLPAASPALVVAAIIGFGRALGDTMLALMLAGNATQIPSSLLDSIRTMTAHISLVVATDSHSHAYHSLFACGIILFIISISASGVVRLLRVGR